MGGAVSLAEYLFSSAGRLGRVAFLVGAAALLGLAFAVRAALPAPVQWMSWLFDAPALFCGLCITAKRLHDRNLTGWWAGVVIAAVMMLWTRPHGVMAFVAVVVLAWAFVALVLVGGDAAANRFGPAAAGRRTRTAAEVS
jgi:uncharacterized membrane protein YhaH (DUF805 family)